MPPASRHPLDRPAVLLAVVLAAALVPWLGPVLGRLHTHFIGTEFVDHYGTQWFYWFTEHALLDGTGFAHTDLFFHPWGKDIYADTGANVLDGILAIPFRRLLGPIAGYNAFLLTGLAASAWAVAAFARELTEDRAAAAVGGVLAIATPFLLQEVIEGRATQAIIVLPALFLRQAWRVGQGRGLRAPLLAGLLLALSGFWYWYYALFAGVACLVLGLWWTLRPPPDAGPRWRLLGRYALVAVVAAAICAPVALPLVLSTQAGGGDAPPGLLDVSGWSLASVPTVTVHGAEAGLFEWLPLRGSFAFATVLEDGVVKLGERPTAPTWGIAAVLVAGLALLRRPRRGGLLALLLACTALAMGPMLVLGEGYVGNPFYILLAQAVGVVQRLWWPGRAFALVVVLFGGAAAVVLAALGRRSPWLRLAGALGLLGLSAHGLLQRGELPAPLWKGAVPAGFRCLAHGPPGGIIQLPFHWAQGHVYYQTAHGRPMLGGMRDEQDMFTPHAWQEFRERNGMVRALIHSAATPDPRMDWEAREQEEVHDLGFEYVVVQLDSWEPLSRDLPTLAMTGTRNRRRRLQAALGRAFGPPVWADARTEIYAPWGAPPPCGAEVEPEAELVGQPDPSLATGLSADSTILELEPWLETGGRTPPTADAP